MSRFPYFGSSIHALFHCLKAETKNDTLPAFETLEGRVEEIIRDYARHIPRGAQWDLYTDEQQLIARYWRQSYDVVASYKKIWLKRTVDDRKHDIIGMKDGFIHLVDVVCCHSLHDIGDIFSEHRGFQGALASTHATSVLLEYACRKKIECRVMAICNDMRHWYEPVWLDTTDWYGRRKPITQTQAPLLVAAP